MKDAEGIGKGLEGQDEELLPRPVIRHMRFEPISRNLSKCLRRPLSSPYKDKGRGAYSDFQGSVTIGVTVKVVIIYMALVP